MRFPALHAALIVIGLGGCANDPQYLQPPADMEAGMDDGMGGTTVAKAQLTLPIKPETSAEMAARMTLANKLGVMVPYVKVGDIDTEVEWTITNLDDSDGIAMIELNGANEWFRYDPSVIVLDPTDDEAPPTPGLQGDIPLDVPAKGSISGTFREDQILEASIDLDQITRGHVNPFAAVLTVNKNDQSFQPLSTYIPPTQTMPMPPMQTADGPAVPREAFAEMIEIDLVFKPDHHMTLDYDIRVRDHRGIMNSMGLDAPANQLTMFAPAVYMVGM
ncbi:MAG TPA: hypothetical protein VLX92_13095 [Kofleriaceae bacterium]|nr:hypothetical protein [Kofleriaceae bacterium]